MSRKGKRSFSGQPIDQIVRELQILDRAVVLYEMGSTYNPPLAAELAKHTADVRLQLVAGQNANGGLNANAAHNGERVGILVQIHVVGHSRALLPRVHHVQGNYDYYLEKKEVTERLYLDGIGYGVEGKGKDVTGNTTSGTASAATETKLDWQQQKEEQAKLRKRQNDLKKTEEEIERVETRMAELDTALADPAIASDHTKLTELSRERESLEETLEKLMEQWEELAE